MAVYFREDLEATMKEAAGNRDEYNQMLATNPLPWSELAKIEFSSHLQEMKDNIVQVNEYLEQWEAWIKKIKNDEDLVKAESKLLHQWKNKDEHRALLKDINKLIRKCEDYLKLESIADTSSVSSRSFNNTQVVATLNGSQVLDTSLLGQVPTFGIPKFNGEYIKWNAFWQRYNPKVHMQPLPDIEKMIILLGLLEGRALEEVEGFEVNEANYPTVVNILQKRFGNHERVIMELQTRLRSLVPAKPDNAESLRTTVNAISNTCQQLENYGIDVNNNAMKLDMIDKMPQRERRELKRLIYLDPAGTTTEIILNKMKDMALIAEYDAKDLSTSSPSSHVAKNDQRSSAKAQSSSNNKRLCTFCNEDHASESCTKFATVDSKLQQLKAANRCTICAGKSHEAKQCYSKVRCKHCDGSHQSFLCKAKSNAGRNFNNTKALLSVGKTQGLLLSKEITVSNPDSNETKKVIVFFDSGSQRSYISNELMRQLKLDSVNRERLNVQGFGSKVSSYSSDLVQLRIETCDGHQEVFANSAKQIASAIPVVEEQGSKAGKVKTVSRKPDILIGMDYFFEFITSFVKRKDNLYTVESKVGQMICGKVPYHKCDTVASLVLEHDTSSSEDDDNLQKFWKLEDMGIIDTHSISTEDKQALEKFLQTAKFKDNRFFVSWPVKENHKPLPTNAGLALGRLTSTWKKLSQDETLMEAYDKIIKNQQEIGTIEIAPKVPQGKLVHYLAHHAVVTPQKATTKVRMVFDASARISKHAPSLNECLIRGPINLPDLCGLLFRLRTGKYVLIGDIEKAFHQIYLNEADRDAVRFFWLKDTAKPPSDDNMVTFRFVGIPFGAMSSPFLLSACIHLLLSKLDDVKLQSIEKNNYVDNMFFIVDSPEEGIEQFQAIRNHFLTASMNIREWLSNSQAIMEAIPEKLRQASETTKVLGIEWNSKLDTFKIELANKNNFKTWTKRNVLKFVASTFDPLGFLSPVTIKGRAFMQKLFKEDCKWDEQLSEVLVNEWKLILNEWKGVVEVPRKLITCKFPDPKEIEIHAFADASQTAYCACVYLRIPTPQGFETPLIFAKTKLQPLSKNLTIPKMEIMGIWLASKICFFVAKELGLEASHRYIWTDSQISYYWFQKWPKDVFVTNRLKEVIASKAECLFVPGTLNPADLGTRGIQFNELAEAKQWWQGPTFLKKSRENWPKTPQLGSDVTQTIIALVATAETEVVSTMQNVEIQREFNIEPKTSWQDLKSLVALELKPEKTSATLTASDLAEAEKVLLIQEQQIFLTQKLEREFKMFKDGDNLYRINCRFDHAELLNANPIFLPKQSPLTAIIIMDTHEKLHHSGTPHTLSKIREIFWIPCGRFTVKKCLQKCKDCRAWKGKPFALPDMPTLPASRVNKTKPFQNTGIDYAGPFKIKGKDEKAWMILFTCFTTRLMHLEPVTSMTSEDFLLSFRRFVARRGTPSYVLSDNAKQFKTASSALDELWSKAIIDEKAIDYCNHQNITWDFITERAPWKGGLYERLVALVKNALKQAIGRRFIDFNEFWTFLTEVESCLNSRPLTYVDAKESFVIRPVDFISPSLQTNLPVNESDNQSRDPTYLPSSVCGGERLLEHYYKTVEYLDKFWKLWSQNYLNFLRERNDHEHKNRRGALTREPVINEKVLVYEPDQTRGLWKTAKIISLIQSSDGKSRSAEIEYEEGFKTRRAINHLYPLEEPIQNVPSNELQIRDPNLSQ